MENVLKLLRCPACRARFNGDEAPDEPCRRCGGDLALLRSVFRNAEEHRRRARMSLAAGESGRALSLARQAVTLVDCPATRATLAAALALAERPGVALVIGGLIPPPSSD